VDRQTNGLLVACLEGVLVEFSHDGQAPLRRTFVDTDLRDVLFAGSDLVVTRFRSAQVLYLDAERRVRSRHTLVPNQAGVVPAVAWRAVPTADGSVAVIHQNASLRILDPGPVGGSGGAPAGTGGSPSGSAVGTGGSVVVYYGTRASCSSIVTSSISIINALGEIRHSPSLAGATLPVDIAEGPDGAFVVAVGAARGTRFLEFGRQTVTSSPGTCAFAQSFGPTVFSTSTAAAAASGVAIEPVTGAVLVHRRRHPAIEVYAGGDPVEIPLVRPGTQRWISDGHDLFHADGGFGVACASCHPEGTDDGQVWNFSKGPRRTQPLDVRLSGTAPFHWNGEFENFGALFDDIFAVRMGGGRRTAEQIGSLERFIYRLRPRPALRDPSDDAAERGRPLFEARCANCHAGPRFTSSQSTDIGKGAPTQVPSLLGVGVRAPFMHDGCAPTLAARFEPTCGGTAHGDLNGLDDAGRADLVSYLESL
jgi:mono/diheme cytochrome c family protein